MENQQAVRSLLEAGAHFGHLASQWHPKMKRYIFTRRNNIHVIDLEQTVVLLASACEFVQGLTGEVLFVGAKKQAQEAVAEEATRCGMPFVNQRWIGGMLTNFDIIQKRIDYLVKMEEEKERGGFDKLTKKERLRKERELAKLERMMGGFKQMMSLPSALFIIDPVRERIAVNEAWKMGIPIVAIADTNCNPDRISYPIPANDDAVKSIRLITSKIADAILMGRSGGKQVMEEEPGGDI
jgi:small subunit ribosomal protein S2